MRNLLDSTKDGYTAVGCQVMMSVLTSLLYSNGLPIDKICKDSYSHSLGGWKKSSDDVVIWAILTHSEIRGN